MSYISSHQLHLRSSARDIIYSVILFNKYIQIHTTSALLKIHMLFGWRWCNGGPEHACVTTHTHTRVPRHKCLGQNRLALFELKVATCVFFICQLPYSCPAVIFCVIVWDVYHKKSAVDLVETYVSNNVHGAVSCRQKDTFEMSPRG